MSQQGVAIFDPKVRSKTPRIWISMGPLYPQLICKVDTCTMPASPPGWTSPISKPSNLWLVTSWVVKYQIRSENPWGWLDSPRPCREAPSWQEVQFCAWKIRSDGGIDMKRILGAWNSLEAGVVFSIDFGETWVVEFHFIKFLQNSNGRNPY